MKMLKSFREKAGIFFSQMTERILKRVDATSPRRLWICTLLIMVCMVWQTYALSRMQRVNNQYVNIVNECTDWATKQHKQIDHLIAENAKLKFKNKIPFENEAKGGETG